MLDRLLVPRSDIIARVAAAAANHRESLRFEPRYKDVGINFNGRSLISDSIAAADFSVVTYPRSRSRTSSRLVKSDKRTKWGTGL